MIDLTATLGDLVTADPRRARVLEGLGLDYCCHGQRSLGEAAAEAGLDPAEVAAGLDLPDAPAAGADWRALGLADLADHVVEVHHTYLWNEMGRLAALADKVAEVHGGRHPELAGVRADYRALKDDLEAHLRKEERILFPAIHQLDAAGAPVGVLGPIRQMILEHDTAGELLERLRSATAGYATPDDGCSSYRALMDGLAELEADLHEHIHKENNVLFPRALEADGISA